MLPTLCHFPLPLAGCYRDPWAHKDAEWGLVLSATCQFHTVSPVQSVRLLASDLQRTDIAQLDPEALGNIKKLSVSLMVTYLPVKCVSSSSWGGCPWGRGH